MPTVKNTVFVKFVDLMLSGLTTIRKREGRKERNRKERGKERR